MDTFVTGALGSSFKRGANEQAYRLSQWQQRERQNRERKQQQETLEDQASELMDAALAVATTAEIEAFELELHTYDVATIEALQANGAQIEQVEERLASMLEQAHQLPDGRRVFKTEDGLRVFDEHGGELDTNKFDPDQISDALERWETFSEVKELHRSLAAERSDLLNYQEKLDLARDDLDAGDISMDDFNALKDDLKSSMPDAVRARIPGMEPSTGLDLEFTAEDLDISADMIPSVGAPGLRS